MKFSGPRRLIALQSATEEVREEVVVPEPLAVVVEGPQEQIAFLDLLEQALAIGDAGQGFGEVGTQAFGDRRCQHEVEDLRLERAQDVLGEIARDSSVTSGEVGDELRRIVASAQGQGGQLQGGDPALGGVPQSSNCWPIEGQSADIDQESPRFLLVESQGGGVDLDQFVPHPQSAEGEAGLAAAGDHHLEVMATVVEEKAHRGEGGGILDQVPVVDDDGQRIAAGVDLVDQCGQDEPVGLVAVVFEDLPEFRREVGSDETNRLDEVGQEPHDVVVVGVDAQPGHRDTVVGEDAALLRCEGALAETRGGVNQDQSAAAGIV